VRNTTERYFADWIALHPDSGEQTGFSDDPDGDGIHNGVGGWFGAGLTNCRRDSHPKARHEARLVSFFNILVTTGMSFGEYERIRVSRVLIQNPLNPSFTSNP
jgi:hypothetical protein